MNDQVAVISVLNTIMSELDPSKDEVAIAHLSDAVDALQASSRGQPTRYARSGDLVDGKVAPKGKVRLFK